MVVASDVNCGGCDLNNILSQPDSDALAARKADILNFFRNGGGVMAFSGGETGGGGASATRGSTGSPERCNHYYDFTPIQVPNCAIGDQDVTTTSAGDSIGLQDSFYEESHNAFQAPDAGSPLQVGAVLFVQPPPGAGTRGGGGVAGQPQTLFADVPLQPTIASVASAAACNGSRIFVPLGKVVSGKASATFPQGTTSVEFWAADVLGNPEATHHTLSLTGCAKPAAPTIGVAGTRRACTSASSIHVRISVTAPGTIKSVKVTLDGKTIKTTTKSRFTLRINLKKLKAGRHRLRTVVTDQAGSNKTSTRTIARCAAAKPKHKAAPRFTG